MTADSALQDLNRLRELYDAGFHDAFLDGALRRIVDRQIARDEADLARVNQELANYERQFGMSSDEFWHQYQSGATGDSADFMEWNVFVKMRQRILTRLAILRGDNNG